MKGRLLIWSGALIMLASLMITYLITDILVPPAQTVNDIMYGAGGIVVMWGIKYQYEPNLRRLTLVYLVFAVLALGAPFVAGYFERMQLQAALNQLR